MLLIPTPIEKKSQSASYGVKSPDYGVNGYKYPEISDGILIYGSFKTFGGTEREVNGAYAVENTATVETWFRPDIKSNCRIGIPATGAIYDVLGEPENINMRNQFLKFKVTEVKGGA